MNFRTALIITILLSTNYLLGQNKFFQDIDSLENVLKKTLNDSTKLSILDRLVINYFTVNEKDRIYEVLKELEEISKAQQNHIGVIKAYFYYGQIYFVRNRDFIKGLKYHRMAIQYAKNNEIKNDQMYAKLYNGIGLIYKNLNRYDSAMFFYEKALKKAKAIGHAQHIVPTSLNLSRLHNTLNNLYESIAVAKGILKFGLEQKDQEAIYIGYRRLGEAHYEIRALQSAKNYIERALELSIQLYGEDDSDTYYNYGLLGKVYSKLGEFDKALNYFHKHLAYLRRSYGETHPTQVGLYHDIGYLFDELMVYDSAEYYFDLGLKSLGRKQKKIDPQTLDFLKAKAALFLKTGKKQQFLATVQQVLDYEINDERKRGGIYKMLGDYYCNNGDIEKGMKEYQKSLRAYIGDFNGPKTQDNPTASQVGNNLNAIRVLLAKGKAFERLAEKSRKLELLQKAQNTYLLSDTLIFNSEALHKSDEDAISFFYTWQQIYERGIQVTKQLYEITKDTYYLDLGFYFAERSKAIVLLRVSSQRNILSNFGIQDSLRSYQESLKSNIAYHESKLNEAELNSDSPQIQKYSDRLFTLKNEEQILLDTLKRRYPEYYEFLFSSGDLMSLAALKPKLYKRTLIEYTVGTDSIFVFAIERNKTQLIALEKPYNFNELIDKHSDYIVQKQSEKFADNAYKLYRLLLEPVLNGIEPNRELLIVPDGRLWNVNFDLLLTDNVSNKDFSSLPYLIKKHPISYANSASLLFDHNELSNSQKPDQCLAFSYSEENERKVSSKIDFMALRDATGDLPGTRREVRSISNILPGTYYFGSQASEVNFKNNFKGFNILHLALHGEINDQDPLYSNLKFSPSAWDTLEDNLLHTYEIYNMRFDADLAVLSACNTAQGDIRGGEGVMSLGRAFQYAGVRSLLLSNWEVADRQAPKLMQYFYEGLIEHGYSKSVALQQAKLKYLETAGVYEKAPFYWGNFMILGDPSPIRPSTKISTLLAPLGLLVIFSLVLCAFEFRHKMIV